jgi:hypothetical protein
LSSEPPLVAILAQVQDSRSCLQDHPVAMFSLSHPLVIDIKRRAQKAVETDSNGPMKMKLWMFGTEKFPVWGEWRMTRADRYWPLDDERANPKVKMWLVPGSPSGTLTWNQALAIICGVQLRVVELGFRGEPGGGPSPSHRWGAAPHIGAKVMARRPARPGNQARRPEARRHI